jgi:hypothetical protein
MGPKARSIVLEAQLRPDWTQEQIAAYCGSTYASVKVILYRARALGLIRTRAIDARRWRRGAELSWLPRGRREEYDRVRGAMGAQEARRILKEDLARHGTAV